MEGVDGAISAWVAGACNRISGQELTPEEDEVHADLVEADKLRELDTWEKFDVSPRMRPVEYKSKLRRLDGH